MVTSCKGLLAVAVRASDSLGELLRSPSLSGAVLRSRACVELMALFRPGLKWLAFHTLSGSLTELFPEPFAFQLARLTLCTISHHPSLFAKLFEPSIACLSLRAYTINIGPHHRDPHGVRSDAIPFISDLAPQLSTLSLPYANPAVFEPFLRTCSALSHLSLDWQEACAILPWIPSPLKRVFLRGVDLEAEMLGTLRDLLRTTQGGIVSLSALQLLQFEEEKDSFRWTVEGLELLDVCGERGIAVELGLEEAEGSSLLGRG